MQNYYFFFNRPNFFLNFAREIGLFGRFRQKYKDFCDGFVQKNTLLADGDSDGLHRSCSACRELFHGAQPYQRRAADGVRTRAGWCRRVGVERKEGLSRCPTSVSYGKDTKK